MDKYIIYALVDPRNDQIRYVGKSGYGLRRPKSHKEPHHLARDKGHKANWIRQLVALGLEYRITILEVHSGPDLLSEAEMWWIAFLRSKGAKLTNMTAGGEGSFGCFPNEDTRQKMSERTKGENNPMFGRSAMKGKKHTPEDLEKMRTACVHKHTEETVRKMVKIRLEKRSCCKLTVEQEIELAGLYKQGLSAQKLAPRFNIDPRTVFDVLRRQQIPSRPQGARGTRPFRDHLGHVYSNQAQAARELGIDQSDISRVLNGKKPSINGFVFTYIEAGEE